MKTKQKTEVAVIMFAHGEEWAAVATNGKETRVYTNGGNTRVKSLKEGTNLCLKMGCSIDTASTESYYF